MLLVLMAALVRAFPPLWEIAVAGVLGGIYWIFFRIPPSRD
ncbi:MAG: hypothetical protein PHD19_16570 [Dechloromonas sp.]|nr:hypothetical protein [Dechloromonas sp.]